MTDQPPAPGAQSGKTIRIGCASGFWGDSMMAAPQLVRRGRLDYLVFDYLAEITMSILARQRAKDPKAGYAHDFVHVTMKGLIREIAEQGIKVVSNAGGVNPKACAEAIEEIVKAEGLDLTVAYVSGDDLLDKADMLRDSETREMFSGAEMPAELLSLNAYLGGRPVAEALKLGADIVVTGRCVDSAVTLGPCLYEFGWSDDRYDEIAGASLAGHIIECGAQACGGLFTDWDKVENWADIGYAIAEVSADGSFVATKPEGTGGLVTPATVAEQMLYEIGDPQAYYLADVVCDFAHVTMEEAGKDRVLVKGAKGYPPTDHYKASATWQDGFRVGQYITIVGIDAAAKARKTAEAVFQRMEVMLREANLGPFSETSVEVVGAEDSYGDRARATPPREVVLKLAAKHPEQRALNMLVREATSSATSMAPGTTGMGGNRPKVSPVVRLFSCLIPKGTVTPFVHIGERDVEIDVFATPGFSEDWIVRPETEPEPEAAAVTEVPLVKLAWGRSGDKGDKSNIGIIARKPHYLPWIRKALTASVVAGYFGERVHGEVQRFEVPGIQALNFLMDRALGGGGIASLRNDPQGKAMAQQLLDIMIPVPEEIARDL